MDMVDMKRCTCRLVCSCGYWARVHEEPRPGPTPTGTIEVAGKTLPVFTETSEKSLYDGVRIDANGGHGGGSASSPAWKRSAVGFEFRSGFGDPDKPGPDWATLPDADNCICGANPCRCGFWSNGANRPRKIYADPAACYCIGSGPTCVGCPKWTGTVDGRPFTFLWVGAMQEPAHPHLLQNFDTRTEALPYLGPRQFSYQFAMRDSLPPLAGIPPRGELHRHTASGAWLMWGYGDDGFGRYEQVGGSGFRTYSIRAEGHDAQPPRNLFLGFSEADAKLLADVAAKKAPKAGKPGVWRAYWQEDCMVLEIMGVTRP